MLDALLNRIGLPAPPPPTPEGLREVHRAYLSTVPYEDLAIHLGEQRSPVDPDHVLQRVLRNGRGGYCFELNGLLANLLEDLGFAVDRRRSVVGDRDAHDRPVNHLVLIVTAGGERWLCDAGYGEAWLDPLRLAEGTQHQPPFHWTLSHEGDDGWWLQDHEWTSNEGFRILPGTVTLDAFADAHTRLSTDPDSSFVQNIVIQQPRADRILTVRGRTFSDVGPHGKNTRVLADAHDFRRTLHDTFGITLTDDEVSRLWSSACLQHDRWVQRQGQ